MEDDDIEYDITFPSPVAGENSIDGIERKEPVVIILGWLGCREKYLAKYGQIYDERGLVSLCTQDISNQKFVGYVHQYVEPIRYCRIYIYELVL